MFDHSPQSDLSAVAHARCSFFRFSASNTRFFHLMYFSRIVADFFHLKFFSRFDEKCVCLSKSDRVCERTRMMFNLAESAFRIAFEC